MSKDTRTNIDPRSAEVLADLVDIYTESGEPVGSKALSEHNKLGLSGATYRNIMRDLEGKGLLASPHTSAGRIPTEEGFRYYAKNLVTVEDLDLDIRKALEETITSDKPMDEVVKEASNLIGQITNYAGLITVPKADDTLEEIQFVRLSGDRVLAVLVTKGGNIENRMIEVPTFMDVKELNKAGSEIKKLIEGQTLTEARSGLVQSIAEQKGRINETIDNMMQAALEWGEPVTSDGAMVVAGSTNLFQYPELVRDRLQGLIKMFEEKRLLMALLEEVQQGEGVQVFVGQESKLEPARDCSLIATSFGDMQTNALGTLGVIGPMRMNYRQTIGVVDYTARLLSKVIEEQNQQQANQGE